MQTSFVGGRNLLPIASIGVTGSVKEFCEEAKVVYIETTKYIQKKLPQQMCYCPVYWG